MVISFPFDTIFSCKEKVRFRVLQENLVKHPAMLWHVLHVLFWEWNNQCDVINQIEFQTWLFIFHSFWWSEYQIIDMHRYIYTSIALGWYFKDYFHLFETIKAGSVSALLSLTLIAFEQKMSDGPRSNYRKW